MELPSWFDQLDSEQKAAADFAQGHSLILAGPGTGKTKTLMGKVVNLVINHNIPPKEILALAFTRVAAKQLSDAFDEALKGVSDQRPQVGTVHSFALRQLVKNHLPNTIPHPVRVATDFFEDKIIFEDLKVKEHRDKKDVRKLFALMSSFWEKCIDPEATDDIKKDAAFIQDWNRHRRIYGYTLRSEMVYQTVRALQQEPNFLLEEGFVHVIVDEYQDLNFADQALIKELAKKGSTITAAGDDDQSIYSFRHANPSGIIEFDTEFPKTTKFFLTKCYRCDKEVFHHTNELIKGHPNRIDKGTTALPEAATGTVQLHSHASPQEEARSIAGFLKQYVTNNPDHKVLILLKKDRNGVFSKPIIDELATLEVPANQRLKGSPWDSELNQVCLAICRLIDDRNDSISWRIVIQFSKNGLGEQAVRWLHSNAENNLKTFAEVLESLRVDSDDTIEKKVSKFYAKVKGLLHKIEVDACPLPEQIKEIISFVYGASAPSSASEFIESAAETSGTKHLKDLPKRIYEDEAEQTATRLTPGIHIMTMHTSKGLTAETVIIPAIEDEIMPGDVESLEEENEALRLLFVAATRAKHQLHYTRVASRYGSQSHYTASGSPEVVISKFLASSGLWPADWPA